MYEQKMQQHEELIGKLTHVVRQAAFSLSFFTTHKAKTFDKVCHLIANQLMHSILFQQ